MAVSERFGAARALLEGAVGAVYPAAELLVVDGGEPVLSLRAGDCGPGTVFDLASLTKPLCTTTLVMRHLEAGRMSLGDELRPGVTVRLALCHASGLPAWRPYFQLLAGAADGHAAVIAAARAEPLERPPGERSVYSDLGFLLLGDAVERVGGAPLDAQWRALGLSAATFHPDPAACAPTEGGLRGVVHDDTARFMGPGVGGHAGLFGDAAAVAAVTLELLAAWRGEAGRVVAAETVRRFFAPAGIAGSSWCLGWDRPSASGYSSAGGRWPRDGVGHTGFTGTSLWVDPARDRFVVLLSNRVHPGRDNDAIRGFRPRLHDAVLSALDEGAVGSPGHA